MNSLYKQLNLNSQINKTALPKNIKQMITMYKLSANPQAMAEQLLQENPQLQTIINAANGDYKKAFETMAKQLNVDPNIIMNLLK